MARAARGEEFLLQGGDCAETFDSVQPTRIRRKTDVLHRVARVLADSMQLPVTVIGRIGGQYAKPRSHRFESRRLPDGRSVKAFSYLGDAVNSAQFDSVARIPDPQRLLQAYYASARTVRILSSVSERQVYTSHEALLLDYESSLARWDDVSGLPYGLSGHLLWIGERTRALDEAHIEFVRRLGNPIAVKLAASVTPEDIVRLSERLDPAHVPGRLTLITRLGARRIREVLPPLIERMRKEGINPVWMCDPMHGNTRTAASGHKTRDFDTMVEEAVAFLEVHKSLESVPAGLHLEVTGDDVTECVGGSCGITEEGLPLRYESACDPRLNSSQAMEFATAISKAITESTPDERGLDVCAW